jgi:hypothetical protein
LQTLAVVFKVLSRWQVAFFKLHFCSLQRFTIRRGMSIDFKAMDAWWTLADDEPFPYQSGRPLSGVVFECDYLRKRSYGVWAEQGLYKGQTVLVEHVYVASDVSGVEAAFAVDDALFSATSGGGDPGVGELAKVKCKSLLFLLVEAKARLHGQAVRGGDGFVAGACSNLLQGRDGDAPANVAATTWSVELSDPVTLAVSRIPKLRLVLHVVVALRDVERGERIITLPDSVVEGEPSRDREFVERHVLDPASLRFVMDHLGNYFDPIQDRGEEVVGGGDVALAQAALRYFGYLVCPQEGGRLVRPADRGGVPIDDIVWDSGVPFQRAHPRMSEPPVRCSFEEAMHAWRDQLDRLRRLVRVHECDGAGRGRVDHRHDSVCQLLRREVSVFVEPCMDGSG